MNNKELVSMFNGIIEDVLSKTNSWDDLELLAKMIEDQLVDVGIRERKYSINDLQDKVYKFMDALKKK